MDLSALYDWTDLNRTEQPSTRPFKTWVKRLDHLPEVP